MKRPFSTTQHKSMALHSSSEENILPPHGAPKRGVATYVGYDGRAGEGVDMEKGIKKETTMHVKYDDEDDVVTSPGSK